MDDVAHHWSGWVVGAGQGAGLGRDWAQGEGWDCTLAVSTLASDPATMFNIRKIFRHTITISKP